SMPMPGAPTAYVGGGTRPGLSPDGHELVVIEEHVDQVLARAQVRVGGGRNRQRSAARELGQVLLRLQQRHLSVEETHAGCLFLTAGGTAERVREGKGHEGPGIVGRWRRAHLVRQL